ncbi:MAG: hypothetical protein HQL03_02930 [Nitrospirae bacterium]|nr:hypothetical protein [Nitrospirota bacterium]MBF0590857.1 hypothetical protein [Nitrospirota bacterium]
MFEVFYTGKAKDQLIRLKSNSGLAKRYSAVKKAIGYLSQNPKYAGLNTHEFKMLKGPKGEKVFTAYAEQSTPAAYRIFWHYGPEKDQITIIAVTSHP